MSVCTHKATGAVAIATTLAPGRSFQLLEVRIHLSAAGGAGDFTAKVDSITSAAYDLNFIKQDMTAVIDFVWQPDHPMQFETGDEIDFEWANGAGRTYGLEIKYNPL